MIDIILLVRPVVKQASIFQQLQISSKSSIQVKPGWYDNVQKLKDEALSYQCLWKSNGCP